MIHSIDFFTPRFVAPVRKELGRDMVVAPKCKCQILLMLVNDKYVYRNSGTQIQTPLFHLRHYGWGWMMVMLPGKLLNSAFVCLF